MKSKKQKVTKKVKEFMCRGIEKKCKFADIFGECKAKKCFVFFE